MRAIDEIRFHLDTPEPVAINAEEYALEGWFFVAGNSQPGDGLVVVVDGTPLPVHTGVSRPDVARHVGEPGVANCGFIARFKAPVFDARVTLMAQTGDGALVLANMAVEPPARPATGERPLVSSYSEWIAIREPALFWPAN